MPRARTGGLEEDFSDPGAEYGIVNDPRKFLFFIYFFGNSFYHLLLTYMIKYVLTYILLLKVSMYLYVIIIDSFY